MRFHGFMLIVSGLLVSATWADDSAAARTLVDEAIRAHGGEAALARYPGVTVKTEGIFQGYERTPAFFFSCRTTSHGAKQYRSTLEGELFKQKFRIINVLDGRRGWIEMSGEGKQIVKDCTPAQLSDFQESGYVNWVTTFLPIRSGEFTLSLAREQKERNRALVGVRVSSRGHRDVTLFFDKETRLLVKTEERATAGTGLEGKVETVLGRHKAVQGVQRPMHWTVYYNGVGLYSHDVVEYKLDEKPDNSAFTKP